jgi:hypothetical protein
LADLGIDLVDLVNSILFLRIEIALKPLDGFSIALFLFHFKHFKLVLLLHVLAVELLVCKINSDGVIDRVRERSLVLEQLIFDEEER